MSGKQERAYWSEDDCQREELLGLFIAYLLEHRWGTAIDSGWSDWDLEFSRDSWTVVRVSTVQEDHGSGRRLIRLRYVLRPDSLVSVGLGLAIAEVGLFHDDFDTHLRPVLTDKLQ